MSEKLNKAIEFIRLIASEESWVYDPYMGWGYPKNRWDGGLFEMGGAKKDCKDIAQELLKELEQ